MSRIALYLSFLFFMNSCAYVSQSKVPQSIYQMVFDDEEEITEQELKFFGNIGELKEVSLSFRKFPSLSEIPSRESLDIPNVQIEEEKEGL